MGPKKDRKETAAEPRPSLSIDDPINTDHWRCVVVLAVEKTVYDSFALKEFTDECTKGIRPQISFIDFEVTILKILQDFDNGELPYKYKLLLNFSSLFEEAVECIKNKVEIPTTVLVNIVKALLFYVKEESMARNHSFRYKNSDPIKAMAERPSNFGENEKKRDVTRKGGNGLKIRPPSATKQDTKLLKRGERAKDDQCIDDAPRNAYFDHYVLLSGFHNPKLPVELIKAGIPLHGVLCIDMSRSGVKADTVSNLSKFSRRNTEQKAIEVQHFWDTFLKKLWDPQFSYYFRDTVFQMYVPRKLPSVQTCIKKFIYKEISCLLYDLSDLKRKLNNYINHIHMWNVGERDPDVLLAFLVPDFLPNECINVPITLQYMMNAICSNQLAADSSCSILSVDSSRDTLEKFVNPSVMVTQAASVMGRDWEMELEDRGDPNLLNIYYKIKELDILYGLERSSRAADSERTEDNISRTICAFELEDCGKNLKEALETADTIFHVLWGKYKFKGTPGLPVDYCLYATLMTRIFCSYQKNTDPSKSIHSNSTRISDFDFIENFGCETRKPHFTITDGSRSILRSIPHNIKHVARDFFCPAQFKVVSPEKLRASSAPQFRTLPRLKVQTLYTSETRCGDFSQNPYENLKGFVDDCLFSKANEFDCIEFFNKSKLLKEEKAYWKNYNCMDDIYCAFNDSLLIMLHNRNDGQNLQHETFNEKLRTPVGLRDFYDYVQEDEEEWLTLQEEVYQAKVMLSNRVIESNSLRDYDNSDFWLTNSLKFDRKAKKSILNSLHSEVKIAYSSTEKIMNPNLRNINLDTSFVVDDELEGYDVADMAVQYSGLKTVFYSEESVVAVELIERLYGNQDLGIHVTLTSHTLHLYSYVCPEPHIQDPFTFHVMYNNGVIVAFSRRFIENVEERKSEPSKAKENTSSVELPMFNMIKDENFLYDMAASLPNGLCIRTVRNVVEPCYIKQYYVGKKGRNSALERSRLILPEGIVIVFLENETVKIFNPNTSVVTAKLANLIKGTENGNLTFSRYEVVLEDGWAMEVEEGVIESSHRHWIFQNKDWWNNRTFFRRGDGANYLSQNESLCVQFEDGTKIWSSVFLEEDKSDYSGEFRYNASDDFAIVHVKTIVEHPDYATVLYNSDTMTTEILLPSDSSITVHPNGQYSIDIDKTTQLKVMFDLIQMNKLSDGKISTSFTADLSVFENNQNKYCQLKESSGKTFVIEKNSNCYIDSHKSSELEPLQGDHSEVELSDFVASTDLQLSPSLCNYKGNKLCRENKYFMVRRDLTGLAVLHVDDVQKILNETEKGTLVFTQTLPGTENRCFVIISPVKKTKVHEWQVETILPNPKYEEDDFVQQLPSTYGEEISTLWMHPLPKKKRKFQIPSKLTCRLFMETKKTKLSPSVGSLDGFFCDMEELTEIKHCNIHPDGVDVYLNQLAHDNQKILREMYSMAASSVIYARKRKVDHWKELQKYLENSKYINMMNEYYKNCIRFKKIPKYFDNHYGRSWHIINDIIKKKVCSRTVMKPFSAMVFKKAVSQMSTTLDFESISDNEIEYDLSVSDVQSYSDLSYRSELSGQSAPAILRTVGLRCKVQPVRNLSSAPGAIGATKCREQEVNVSEEIAESTPVTCEIRKEDLESFRQTEIGKAEKPPMTLEDLMFLGFI